jgi:transposase
MSMPNYLKMPKKSQVLALLELGWSYRRIERETGVRRETVSGYDEIRRANAAKTFPGSALPPLAASGEQSTVDGPNPAKTFAGSDPNPATTFLGSGRFAAARYHDAIVEKRAQGLTVQRIWQDLTEEFGYGHSYESVKRFLRTIAPRGRPVGVFESDPGQEGQVDFFRGAPTLDAATGQWKRPWVFRLTLACSRHGYEEAVWDQQLETFLRLHERAFRDLGGAPTVVRYDYVTGHIIELLCPLALCASVRCR